MADLKTITKERLLEAFNGETQETTAFKLNTTQGNVSKWIKGIQIPTPDTLVLISNTYKVSVDWILGISEQKEIDGVVLEKLTYKQIALILDSLIENNTIEIPDLVSLANEKSLIGKDSDEFSLDDEEEHKESLFDSDFIKIKDRLLSQLMRRRYTYSDVDLEMIDSWREKLGNFQEIQLLKYSDTIQEAIDLNSPAQFKDGDWVELVTYLSKMTIEEQQQFIAELKKKEGAK